jgi:gas vesicle protein
MSEKHVGSMMGGFLLGAAVGAGLALIFAPMSGDETRRRIGIGARRLRHDAQGRIDGVTSAIKDRAGDLGAAIEAGKDAYRRNSEPSPVVQDRV